MAIKIMNLVWSNAACKDNTLLTLLALADWANDEAVAWPSVGTLAKKTRQSERNVQRTLRTLETMRLIEPLNAATKSISYRINIELLADDKLSPVGVTNATERGDKHGDKLSPNTKTTISRSNHQYTNDFENFFRNYPRPVAKRRAAKSYADAITRLKGGEYKNEKLSDERAVKCIMVATERFTVQVTREKREEQHIPHPATWLNGACYLDQFTGARKTQQQVSSESQSSLLDEVQKQLRGER